MCNWFEILVDVDLNDFRVDYIGLIGVVGILLAVLELFCLYKFIYNLKGYKEIYNRNW